MNETQHIEFKSGFNEEVIETLTAFANTKGGKVLVGVSNKGLPVKGFTVGQESIQLWINEIKNKTQPSIIPDAEIIEYKGEEVVEFSVQEFPVKPVACRGRYFKRVKNSNHLLSVSEISDVYLRSMQYSWDAYPFPNSIIDSLNLEKVSAFVSKVNSIGRFHLPDNPRDALIKLKMLHEGIPTNAAMILFSKENLLYNVHIGRFKTPSLIIADNMINGNLYDVVEESMQTIIGHLKFAFEITGKTTQRTEIPEYPLDAIRETLLNTLIHRDYQSSTDVQIKIFDQKITFFNPGGLYGNITEEELHTDTYQASTRNKQLAEAFYLTHDIEKYGSGFIRIRQAIVNYPTMRFDFQDIGNGFVSEFSYTEQKTTTIFDNVTDVTDNVTDVTDNVTDNVTDVTDNVTDNVTDVTDNVTDVTDNVTDVTDNVTDVTDNVTDDALDRTDEILKLIAEHEQIFVSEIAKHLHVTKRTILRDIEKLKKEKLVERIGPGKGGYWKIIRKIN
jgi:ATP-dependent DNA helicase RecG